MKKTTILLTAILAATTGLTAHALGSAPTTDNATTVSAEAKQEIIFIDVRTPEEFAAGHIQGAVNIPYEQIKERIGEVTTDKNANIHLYCKSGRRAGIALESLKEEGFTNLTNRGGYEDLRKELGQ
ncbi:rhodanese-like domain-containing protein [Pelistega sp. NLN82]|uniref:Rhodanese-like domain-containing protein n=2 Tax=Pelistega ratti TaxID=2652177 RepID=A0A6L9Y827_9BURK|nr:rhodanese-like domain-containing protein [Pelistega ratti]